MFPEAATYVLVALLWDGLLGEPPNRLHPVVYMGNLIAWLKDGIPRGNHSVEFVAGLLLAIFVPSLCAALSFGALELLSEVYVLKILLGAYLLKSSFAMRCLHEAVARVGACLKSEDLREARAALGWLCSRDASELQPSEITAAAMESAAENASDGFVAPLFYFLLFGIPGAIFYRAVNTLDAMVGYRGPLEYVGKASARLDDFLNLIPARLTAALLLLGGLAVGANVRQGLGTALADHGETESPNAGWPMATMAGMCNVCLEKAGHYQLGKGLDQPTAASLNLSLGVLTFCAILTGLLTLGIAMVRL